MKPATKNEEPKTKPPAAGAVTVKALVHLHEDSTTYLPGQTFTTTKERAAALGDSVEVQK